MRKCCSLFFGLLCAVSPIALQANCCTGWLPQFPLWQPLLADPRQVCFYAAYRSGSDIIGQTLAAVSFGDDFPIYQWTNVWNCRDALQIGIEGDVYGLFNLDTFSHDLVNADYYVGVPLTYRNKQWTFRARLYHISSHLGDEYLLDHPDVVRTNPSIEAVDVYAVYQWTCDLKIYAAIGDFLISDTSFRQWPLYINYGFEYKPTWWRDYCRDLIWKPFIAVFLQNREMNGWYTNQSYAIGMEIGKMSCNIRKARISIEWYDGYDPDGQLQIYRTNYAQFKLAYGY